MLPWKDPRMSIMNLRGWWRNVHIVCGMSLWGWFDLDFHEVRSVFAEEGEY